MQYDLIIMGATGFTGKLVIEYLIKNYGVKNDNFTWAIAGRDIDKLTNLKKALKSISPRSMEIDVLTADSHDKASLDNLTAKCKVIVSAVGPYLNYGHLLIKSCAQNGTHYCDLTGEVPFIKESIEQVSAIAKENNCKIIHSCGFDSIPSDIGVLLLQNEAMKQFGSPLNEIKLYVRAMRGGISGGTIESMINIYEYIKDKPDLQKALKDPYSLTPNSNNTNIQHTPSLKGVQWDQNTMRWLCPFAMSGINTKIVRASNGLMNNYYGKNFQYSEVVSFSRGLGGFTKALGMTLNLAFARLAIEFNPLIYILRKLFLPAPGQGPTREDRENGFFKMHLTGSSDNNKKLNLIVRGDSDAGYSGTAKMITESALSLLLEKKHIPNSSGVLTPASGIGEIIVKRLKDKGITFKLQ